MIGLAAPAKRLSWLLVTPAPHAARHEAAGLTCASWPAPSTRTSPPLFSPCAVLLARWACNKPPCIPSVSFLWPALLRAVQVCKGGMTNARKIWLTRHGESVYNQQALIGGDSPLSPNGQAYAELLPDVILSRLPKVRTGEAQQEQHLKAVCRGWSRLLPQPAAAGGVLKWPSWLGGCTMMR